ncbi:hypothetical protein AB4114_33885 [Paenibacillus sp. 2RAB27]
MLIKGRSGEWMGFGGVSDADEPDEWGSVLGRGIEFDSGALIV